MGICFSSEGLGLEKNIVTSRYKTIAKDSHTHTHTHTYIYIYIYIYI